MSKTAKEDSSENNWIKCQSKSRKGVYYMFNKGTGESRWETSTRNDGDFKKPLPSVSKSVTPAQDRLKRLQKSLQNKPDSNKLNSKNSSRRSANEANSTKRQSNELSKHENTASDQTNGLAPSCYNLPKEPRLSPNISNYAENNTEATCPHATSSSSDALKNILKKTAFKNKKRKKKTKKVLASVVSGILCDIDSPLSSSASNSQNRSNIQKNDNNLDACVKDSKNDHENFQNSASPSRIQDQMSPSLHKRPQKSQTITQDVSKNVAIPLIPLNEKPASQHENNLQEKMETESVLPTATGMGIVAKIKGIFKSFCNQATKRKSSNEFESCSVVKSRTPRKANTAKSSSNESLSTETSTSLTAPMSSVQMTVHHEKKGTANTRLERLRQSLLDNCNDSLKQPANKTTEEICFSSTSTKSLVVNEFEPMDWQPIPCTDNKDAGNNKAESTQTSHTASEYYDTVNENLLRFAAEKQRSVGNEEAQKWHHDFYYFIIDTNVLIENLAFIGDLAEMKLCDTKGTIVYVPYLVLQELDKLKVRSPLESTKVRAVCAIKYLNRKFKEKYFNIKAQSATEECIHLITVCSPDDSIINCCLQVKENIPNYILLTEDRNLRNKAFSNMIPVSTKSDLTSKHPDSESPI